MPTPVNTYQGSAIRDIALDPTNGESPYVWIRRIACGVPPSRRHGNGSRLK